MKPKGDDLVLTPGGKRPRHLVHQVGPGQVVRGDTLGNVQVENERIVSMPQNLVLTPGGYRHPSLVHRVDPGFAVHVAEGKNQLRNLTTGSLVELVAPKFLPGQVPGFGSGWIADAFWQNETGKPVTSFKTTWKVPPAPKTSSGQTIFLFNGIDPADPSQAILQPVLQWGTSHAGGGPFWSIASWFVSGNGQAFFTPLVPVNVGDTLVGKMTLTGQGNGLFSYQSEFEGIAGTNLPVQNVTELVWCNETLEAYSITACSDYPDATFTAMQSIELQTGNVTPPVHWTIQDLVTDCGQHATVPVDSGSDGEVDLFYRPAVSRIPWSEFAQFIEILFGVTQDGGGVGIVNGHIVIIPPRGPASELFQEVAAGLKEVVRGFELQRTGKLSSVQEAGRVAEKAGLEMVAKGLELASASVRKAMQGARG
jgi:hypothetical protein